MPPSSAYITGMVRNRITRTGARTSGVNGIVPLNGNAPPGHLARHCARKLAMTTESAKGEGKPRDVKGMPGAGLTRGRVGRPERSALRPDWAKPAVRNFTGRMETLGK